MSRQKTHHTKQNKHKLAVLNHPQLFFNLRNHSIAFRIIRMTREFSISPSQAYLNELIIGFVDLALSRGGVKQISRTHFVHRFGDHKFHLWRLLVNKTLNNCIIVFSWFTIKNARRRMIGVQYFYPWIVAVDPKQIVNILFWKIIITSCNGRRINRQPVYHHLDLVIKITSEIPNNMIYVIRSAEKNQMRRSQKI